jgi:hypothetical protein
MTNFSLFQSHAYSNTFLAILCSAFDGFRSAAASQTFTHFANTYLQSWTTTLAKELTIHCLNESDSSLFS